MNNLI